MEPVQLNGPLLCIDTSIPVGSVALAGQDSPEDWPTHTGSISRAENLFPVIRELLDEYGLEPAGLGGVAVASGPGSFTGLRIAASTAKTLAWTLGKPLFAAGSLLCQANRAATSGLPVCAAFDAGRGEFYAACFRWRDTADAPEELLNPGAWDLDSLCRRLVSLCTGGKVIMLGQGYLNRRAELDEKLSELLEAADDCLHEPDARSLGQLVLAAPERYLVDRIGTFEPDYIRVGQVGLRLG